MMEQMMKNRDAMQMNMEKVVKILEVELSGEVKMEVMDLIKENQDMMAENIGMHEKKMEKKKGKRMFKNGREKENAGYEDMYKKIDAANKMK